MKKLILFSFIFVIFACKKEEATEPSKAAVNTSYTTGVFFRVEKNAITQNMDSVGIWVSSYKPGAGLNYTYRGRITGFSSIDCSGDGLRLQLDTGAYYYKAQYYGTTYKSSSSGFTVKSTACMNVVEKP